MLIVFDLILQVFERSFLSKISDFDGKEWLIEAGKNIELHWTFREYNETVFNVIV